MRQKDSSVCSARNSLFSLALGEFRLRHTLRHTFATTLINGIKQPDGTVRQLTPRELADLLGHSTSEVTERYYVKRDLSRLNGITDGFEM